MHQIGMGHNNVHALRSRSREEQQDREGLRDLNSEDAQLITQCASGDNAAWNRFIERYGGLIYGVAGRYCEAGYHRRELFLYVLEKLWEGGGRRLAAWEGRAKFSTYLATIVSRLCADSFKSRLFRESEKYEPLENIERSWEDRAAPDGRGQAPAAGVSSTRRMRDDCEGLLEVTIGLLADDERAALQLFYWQRRSYAEIAALMNMTAGAVGKTLLRARKKLRQMLAARGIRNFHDILE